MSEKTKEELEAEIKALEGDIKKQQDKEYLADSGYLESDFWRHFRAG